MNDLDAILENFRILADLRGIHRDELMCEWANEKENKNWNLNYKKSLDSSVKSYLENLLRSVDLSRVAMDRGDSLTVAAALVYGRIFALQLADAFSSVADEFQKVLFEDERFDWPAIPDDFKIPSSYDYKGPD